jgi:hypothetical protein
MKRLLFVAVAGIFAFSSCKKENKCNTDVASVSGTYKITAAKYKATSSSAEVDGMSLINFQPCSSDDTYTFNSSGAFTYNDVGVTCDPSGTYTGTWALSGNTITIDGEPATVQSFDCTNLKVLVVDYFDTGDQMVLTFAKQ